ncbi:hcp, partial [Symbiodinium sp. KB8]
MQDCLVETLKGLSYWAEKARELNQPTTDADNFVSDRCPAILPALFSTLTNVNFDPERFVTLVDKAQKLRNEVRDNVLRVHPPAADEKHPVVADWKVNTKTVDDIELAGREVGIESRKKFLPEDAVGLQELIVYGLKGAAAYANHALELGKTDPAVTGFMYKALSALGRNEADPNALVALAMGTGECNLKVLQLLSEGHHTRYGAPTPTKVNIEPVEGKCILVSGHDMRDLERLLEQSAGKGVNVYTHGEMLPAHGYPGLKDKYPHLVGHYGGPWQLQKFDFSRFP